MHRHQTKTTLVVTALAVVLTVAQASADIITVDLFITITDPPIEIIADNNPFDFWFTSLPTTPIGNGTVELTGLADLGLPEESFTVLLDGLNFGTFFPLFEDFFEVIHVPLATLGSVVADGELLVRVNFSEAVDFPLPGDFITTRLSYQAMTGAAEPASAALIAVGLAGLGLVRRFINAPQPAGNSTQVDAKRQEV